MVETVAQPLMVGLRDKKGDMLALMAGWLHAGSATILLQVNNDREYPQDSLCTVLRAYLIDFLIQASIREIMFWGGASGALSRYVEIVPGVQAYLDISTFTWNTARHLVAWIAKSLPRHLRVRTEWVAPGNGSSPPVDANEEVEAIK